MKKILISKFHEKSPSPTFQNISNSDMSFSNSDTNFSNQDTNENLNETKEKSNVQPPLPIGPPPQDLPPIIEIKKEIIDEGYQSLSSKSSPDAAIYDENIQIKKEEPDRRPMCKRFVRGTCTKGAACIFKHEIVLSELYKFCWDYQNKKCERAHCRHVHATIFEEQNFYRTGYLPPRAFAHLNDKQNSSHDNSNVQINGNFQEQSDKLSSDLKYSKEQLQNLSPPKLRCLSPSEFGRKYPKMELNPEYKADLKPTKRAWSPFDELCSGLPEFITEPKNCDECVVKLFRVQMNSNRMEEVMRSAVRVKESLEELEEKTTRLHYITKGLMALEDNKSFEEFINRVVSGNLEITEEKATEIIEAVKLVLCLQKSLTP